MTPLLAFLLAAAQPAPAPPPAPLLSAQGEVTDASRQGEYDIHYSAHPLQLTGGARYRAIVRVPPRGGFPSRIEIHRGGQVLASTQGADLALGLSEGTPIADNVLDFVAPASGAYELRVLALGPEPRGRYAVRVFALPPVPAPRTLPPGATQSDSWRIWTGTIDARDPHGLTGSYDDYPLEMQAGEIWIARVEREGRMPDQYFGFELEIRDPDNPDGGALLGDRGGMDEAPSLAFRPNRSRVYLLRVSGLNIGQGVRYRLSVTRLQDELTPPPATP